MLILHLEGKAQHRRRYWGLTCSREKSCRAAARLELGIHPKCVCNCSCGQVYEAKVVLTLFLEQQEKALLQTCKMVTFHKNSLGRSVGRPKTLGPEPGRGHYIRWSPYF